MLTLSTVLLLGVVSGDPLPVVPGPDPVVWLEYTNDNLLATGPDDGFTAGFAAGVNVDRWWLGLGYDIITEEPKRRSDVVTVTLSYSFDLGDIEWSAGVGSRWAGDFGGEQLQTQFHEFSGDEPIVLPYESGGWRPVVTVCAEWEHQLSDQWDVSVLGSTLGSYDFAQAEVIARVSYGDQGRIWAGVRYAGYVGDHLTRSAEYAFSDWGGPGLAFGVRMDALTIRWTWTGDGIFGALGVAF